MKADRRRGALRGFDAGGGGAAVQLVREASWRVLSLRPFDVQLIGGIILHEGEIAEMRTGEGKTLVSVMPAYLNALSGKGAPPHCATSSLAPLGLCRDFLFRTPGCSARPPRGGTLLKGDSIEADRMLLSANLLKQGSASNYQMSNALTTNRFVQF